jgi:hypothetical protein
MAGTLGIPRVWADLDQDRWAKWLNKLADLDPAATDQRDSRDMIQLVYRAFLRNASGNFESQRIWAVCREQGQSEEWELIEPSHRSKVFYIDRPDLDELPLPGIQIFPLRLGGFTRKAKELLGIEPLSEQITFKVAAATGFQSDTGISCRPRDRLTLLSVACAGPDSDESLRESLHEAFSRLEVRLTDALPVNTTIRENPLGDAPILLPFLHEPAKERLWLSRDYAMEGSAPLERAWSQVAGALLLMPDVPESLKGRRSLLTNLLRMEQEKDIEDILRNEGLTFDDIRQFFPPAPPAPPAPPQPQPQPQPRPQPQPQPPQPPPPPVPDIQNQGHGAQEWLRTRLEDLLNPLGWSVSATAVRDEQNRETDILLSHPSKGELHLEVKRRSTQEVFWSRQEVEKAQDHDSRYWMVVLVPMKRESKNGYQVFWLCNPLSDLAGCDRFCRWNWSSRDEPYDHPAWDVPQPVEAYPPNRFSFRILVPDLLLNQHPSGIDTLPNILKNLPN